MLDLATIRERNKGQPEGYWKVTTAALCDEVERLQKPPAPSPDLDNIRRMLDDGVPVPPWLMRGLVEQVESFQQIATHAEARRLVDKISYDSLYDAVLTWDDAIERCDGIVAAEEALREVVKELRTP